MSSLLKKNNNFNGDKFRHIPLEKQDLLRKNGAI